MDGANGSTRPEPTCLKDSGRAWIGGVHGTINVVGTTGFLASPHMALGKGWSTRCGTKRIKDCPVSKASSSWLSGTSIPGHIVRLRVPRPSIGHGIVPDEVWSGASIIKALGSRDKHWNAKVEPQLCVDACWEGSLKKLRDSLRGNTVPIEESISQLHRMQQVLVTSPEELFELPAPPVEAAGDQCSKYATHRRCAYEIVALPWNGCSHLFLQLGKEPGDVEPFHSSAIQTKQTEWTIILRQE
mmetsp:Transcript_47988/g.88324  ORF Transcript_47988/g.88324 Transcript_47988/m.88324 type:complete len:243 (+) Transcript_47988:363-1091(+)